VHIKLCGLTHPEHVETAATLGVEFIGLVFAERSRRRVTVEQAKRLVAVLPPREPAGPTLTLGGGGLWFDRCADALDRLAEARRPLLVGVFADQPPSLVNSIAEAVGLDLVQLSGDEHWETALQMRRPVIKTVRTEPGMGVPAMRLRLETGMAHLLHLDAYVEGELGGTGRLASWELGAGLAEEMPVMLAGGLTPDNVLDAVTAVRPWAVDVSSGIEREGVKDVGLMQEFVQAARSAAVGMGMHGR
jgi:phosphoribosylanthranilate isomerase